MTMLVDGWPERTNESMSASTTAGRVPVRAPGAEITLKPTTSDGLTQNFQAAAALVLPESAKRPFSASFRTTSRSGMKAEVAPGSETEWTLALAVDEETGAVPAVEPAAKRRTPPTQHPSIQM